MKKLIYILLPISILFLAGCGNQEQANAADAVENYIIALAEKNKNQVVALSCKEWEESATLEVDALLSVEAAVSELNCEIVAEDASGTQVVCSGSLDLTYNDEIRAIDLSRRTYTVMQEDGQWRICSYK